MEELKLSWVTGTVGSLLFALLPFPGPWRAWGGDKELPENYRLLHCSSSLLTRSISRFIRRPVSSSKFLLHRALLAAALPGASQGSFRAVRPEGSVPPSAAVRVSVLAVVLLDALLLCWFNVRFLFHPVPAPSSVKLPS